MSQSGTLGFPPLLRVALNCPKTDDLRLIRELSGGKGRRRNTAKSVDRVKHLLRESPRADEMQELIVARGGPTFPGKDEDVRIEESHKSNHEKADLLDSLYEPVVAWMRENSRGKTLVFEEEISYGFQRNLYALKRFAFCCNGAALLVQVGVIVEVYHWRHHAWPMTPSIAAVILFANLLYLVGVASSVSEESVMVQGFIYARQLFDSLYAAGSAGKGGDSADENSGNGSGSKPAKKSGGKNPA